MCGEMGTWGAQSQLGMGLEKTCSHLTVILLSLLALPLPSLTFRFSFFFSLPISSSYFLDFPPCSFLGDIYFN